jgi:hypothetical protein
MILSRILSISLSTIIVLSFNSCGSTEDTNWGIDHEIETSKQLPVCNGDKNSTTNAMKVYENQEIENLSDDTYIRIWHYQNGDKLVCTVTGKAVIKDEK